MDERVRIWQYQIEGPSGELWSGALLEGESATVMPRRPLLRGDEFKIRYWEMQPQQVSASEP